MIFEFVFVGFSLCSCMSANCDERLTPVSWLQGSKATGAFILTASHNPGGPTEVRSVSVVLCPFLLNFLFCIHPLFHISE